jgi:hypothetical protein
VGSELLEDLRIVRKAVHMKLEIGYDQCSNDSVKNYMAEYRCHTSKYGGEMRWRER